SARCCHASWSATWRPPCFAGSPRWPVPARRTLATEAGGRWRPNPHPARARWASEPRDRVMARELTPEQLATGLARGALAPAYRVAGAEARRVLERADAIRAAAREQGYAEREVFEVEGRDIDWDGLEASLRAP